MWIDKAGQTLFLSSTIFKFKEMFEIKCPKFLKSLNINIGIPNLMVDSCNVKLDELKHEKIIIQSPFKIKSHNILPKYNC